MFIKGLDSQSLKTTKKHLKDSTFKQKNKKWAIKLKIFSVKRGGKGTKLKFSRVRIIFYIIKQASTTKTKKPNKGQAKILLWVNKIMGFNIKV